MLKYKSIVFNPEVSVSQDENECAKNSFFVCFDVFCHKIPLLIIVFALSLSDLTPFSSIVYCVCLFYFGFKCGMWFSSKQKNMEHRWECSYIFELDRNKMLERELALAFSPACQFFEW